MAAFARDTARHIVASLPSLGIFLPPVHTCSSAVCESNTRNGGAAACSSAINGNTCWSQFVSCFHTPDAISKLPAATWNGEHTTCQTVAVWLINIITIEIG